jgi:N6-L-threonylcarbamoyladenine synthase
MSERTLIFGIESSCDETSAAVVADGHDVLSNVVASQIDMHTRFGGVVPELASRAHIEAVNTVMTQALEQAGVEPGELAAVAVTHEPGLIGSLLVGLMAAKTAAWMWGKPIVPVNHVHAHAYAASLDEAPIEYPALALIASGGHTAIYNFDALDQPTLLATTADDAAGEAFDKVSSILELGYPGGPAIDKAAEHGNPKAVRFPRTRLKARPLDFSFSGLKTAVLYHVKGVPGAKHRPSQKTGVGELTEELKCDLAASFQAAAVDVLIDRLRKIATDVQPVSVVLGGGVAANRALRAAADALGDEMGFAVRRPAMKYCTDNAAMIAGLGYHHFVAGKLAGLDLAATATVRR